MCTIPVYGNHLPPHIYLESNMVLHLLCALFSQEQLGMFRNHISDQVHRFADGTPVDTVYGNIPTPLLFFLWQSVLTSSQSDVQNNPGHEECYRTLKDGRYNGVRSLVLERKANTGQPMFYNGRAVMSVLEGLRLEDACDILSKIVVPPSDTSQSWDSFQRFCAILDHPATDQLIDTIKETYTARIHYAKPAYIVKLYLKIKNARNWDSALFSSGMKGNVSTYPLPHAHIASFIDGWQTMPPPAGILSALISVTFIQPNKKLQYPFPNSLLVRRRVVFEALTWLQCYNPLWANIYIDEGRLQQLPENGVPEEITLTARVLNDFDVLAQEQSGYVPEPSDDDDTVFNDLYPNVDASTADQGSTDGEVVSEDINLQSHGVVDANGNEIIDEDLRDHALVNGTLPPDPASFSEEHFKVKRGSRFVSEYGRKSDDGLRTDRGPSNPNHLLGAFPVLFPFGIGGFETSWHVNVPYEVHARWVLMYADRRFHQDLHFVFQVFSVVQKRNICRSSPKDLLLASKQEKRKTPFTNPAVQALRTELTAVRSKVPGTDELRRTLRSKIWSTNVMFNPPNLWITVNPNDTHDPIAQVIVGENIDLDHFLAHVEPTAAVRAKTIAVDPYASTKFFHLIAECTLKALLGISVQSSRGHHVISREKGIFGMVNAYIGTIEAQGRGSLHMHVLIWLKGSLTASEMDTALQSEEFRLRVSTFIAQNIVADIGGLSTSDILAALELKDPSYSCPPKTDYLDPAHIATLARTVQVHTCHDLRCLIKVNNRKVCKRRAPFPRSEEAWIDEKGEWGPRRLYGYVNNFNPPLLVTTRSNHDIKLITNAFRTNNLTCCVGQTIAFHKHTTSVSDDNCSVNKRLLQHCANTLGRLQEFSAQEAVGYVMGWGDHLDTSTIRLEFHGDVLKPKDQVQEYVDWGLPMQCINMFDFFVNTYDTKKRKPRSEKQNGATIGDSQTTEDEGDESSEVQSSMEYTSHVDYLEESGRGSKTRALRNESHETLPDFIGTWFPNAQVATERELHAAYMLMLFKPWRSLDQLLGTPEMDFQTSLADFLAVNPYLRSIVDNINYFHKCLEGEDDEADVNEPEWDVPDITTVDIERARLLRVDQNEWLFAEKTLDHAHRLGIFSDDIGSVPFLPVAALALPMDMMTFQQWHEQLTELIINIDIDIRETIER
ncbi:hypothetical protein ARMSODRAFT_1024597 [Armillaria solidipes]|uniref:Uncharacterized protein n=1 Tax=Armillaria solidipes TaxID=1076256 RepID=A0A2H3AYK9_9AGAR|nr:hypothetical protein ARMSODRAFT_1024597 [Armillaria solidipes]